MFERTPSQNAYTLSIDNTPTTVRGFSIGTIVHALQVPRAVRGWYGACRCWDSIVLNLRNDCRRCTSCDCGKASETANDPRMAIAETNADISVLSLSGLCAHGHSRGSARGNVIVGICPRISSEASQCPAAALPSRPAGAAIQRGRCIVAETLSCGRLRSREVCGSVRRHLRRAERIGPTGIAIALHTRYSMTSNDDKSER